MPRWKCGAWSTAHGWLHIVSDLAIFGAYVAIPAVLIGFMRRRRDVPFSPLFWAFGVFIIACGIGHLIDATMFWQPRYRLSGFVKVVTAIASWGTVAALIKVLPQALALPGLATLNHQLRTEVEERKRLEGQYRELYENSPACYLTVDPADGRIVMCNRTLTDALELPREAIVGRRLPELCDPGCGGAIREALDRLAANGSVHDVELTLLGGGGNRLDVLLDGLQLAEGDEASGLAGCALRNITSRKAAERAIRSSEQRFQAVIEYAPTAMLLVDARGRIVLSNEKAEEYFGWPRSELHGQPVEVLIPERFRAAHRVHMSNFFQSPRPRAMGLTMDLYGCRRDGTEFPVEVGLNPIEMNDDLAVVAAVQDVTKRRQDEADLADFTRRLQQSAEDLERSHRDLEQIAYAASHDLQEPLRAVAGYCQLLQLEHSHMLGGEAADYLRKAVDGTLRMHTLINGLLSYARMQRSSEPFATVDVGAVVHESLQDLTAMIQESRASIRVGTLPTLPGDAAQLRQLFQNLVGNAIKYRSDRPLEISIAAERFDDEWSFCVADNGIGIPAESREQIFMIFQRLHTRDRYPGTGLGLTLCKRIVEGHGGRIWVEGDADAGSRFRFVLPAEAEGEPASRGRGARRGSLGELMPRRTVNMGVEAMAMAPRSPPRAAGVDVEGSRAERREGVDWNQSLDGKSN
ncbi:MAG: PAS domain S-box protein [Planctomyces sp.]|nr:PAS domain S-box protein [Planctomyces sp.]